MPKVTFKLEPAEVQEVVNALMLRAQSIANLAHELTKQANEQIKVKEDGSQQTD